MASSRGKTYTGTSGWSYDHWKGEFYPKDMAKDGWFDFYMDKFDTVEINNSFYNLPSESTFKEWHKNTPSDFLFSVKASRYITHMKKLKDPKQPVGNFHSRVKLLKSKLGPVLFQLPPKWKCNPKRLKNFIDNLPGRTKYTMEFRDDTWWNDDVYEILSDNNISFCIFDLEGNRTPGEVTADFVYIRLHGPDGAYQGKYGKRKLRSWVDSINDWRDNGKDVFCYFDNDEKGYAAKDAQDMIEMLQD